MKILLGIMISLEELRCIVSETLFNFAILLELQDFANSERVYAAALRCSDGHGQEHEQQVSKGRRANIGWD